MSRLGKLLVSVMLVALSLSACNPLGGGPLELAEKDAGRTVELRAGQEPRVVLTGNPTTGYTWEVASLDKAVLKQMGEPEFKADSTALGAGGKFTLRFQAVAAGQTTLQLVYRRPWEKGVAPAQTFEITVTVK